MHCLRPSKLCSQKKHAVKKVGSGQEALMTHDKTFVLFVFFLSVMGNQRRVFRREMWCSNFCSQKSMVKV